MSYGDTANQDRVPVMAVVTPQMARLIPMRGNCGENGDGHAVSSPGEVARIQKDLPSFTGFPLLDI